MGMHIAIGIGDPPTVAQPQALQRTWAAGAVSSRTAISCPATLEVKRTRTDRHRNPAPGASNRPPDSRAERLAVKPSMIAAEVSRPRARRAAPGVVPEALNPECDLPAGRRGDRRRRMGPTMCGSRKGLTGGPKTLGVEGGGNPPPRQPRGYTVGRLA